MKHRKLTNMGFFNLPLHRAFAYYLTRYLLTPQFANPSGDQSVQQINRLMLHQTFHSDQEMTFADLPEIIAIDLRLQRILLPLIK